MRFLIPIFFLLSTLLPAQTPEIPLTPGLHITRSCRIRPGEYRLNGAASDVFEARPGQATGAGAQPVIEIRGDNVTVDFQQALLRGSDDRATPDGFYGLALRIRGANITVKNARIQGYKVAILADSAQGLRLENCDLSYNYRPRLRSIREREDFSDWLSYHQNERDEWLRYGAGIYLKNCRDFTVKNCRAAGNQNALLMTGCSGGLVYNNRFHFNSGLGIGMYRSSNNRVMHNRLDWNVRGYSHGFYQRGQDSAGILCYEQSSNNLFAYNSATHSGDGFFLWAGQSTMDSGEGGCNDNLLFGNDFSHAPTNGIEVTFSRNRIQGNLITECTYGIWGGYSYETLITGNLIADCRTGIAIEHGQHDTIRQNLLQYDSVGIYLWARATQPADWGYAQKRDTRSRDAIIDRNVFLEVPKPLKISNSENIAVNGENLFAGFRTLLENPKPNAGLRFLRNDLYAPAAAAEAVWQNPELVAQRNLNFSHPDQTPANPYAPLEIPAVELREPDSLPDGLLAALPTDHPRGRQYILVDEWGPYDFRRPVANITAITPLPNGGSRYTVRLLGPRARWRVTEQRGVAALSAASGELPGEITFERPAAAPELRLEWEALCADTCWTVFGEALLPGAPYRFRLHRFEQKLSWTVRFFNYAADNDPLQRPGQWEALTAQAPAAEKKTDDLYFAWWDSPAPGVQADRFAALAESDVELAPGRYRIELTSDDGVRLYIDGKRVIDHWDVHEPATDEIRLPLGGKHHFRIEYVEAGGFGALDFRIRPEW